MTMPFRLALAALGLIPAAIAAQPVTRELEAVQGQSDVDSTTVTQDIAFRADRYRRMTIPVTINGSGPFRFLIDTAADRTVVSTRVASDLRLAPGPSATLHSATGSSRVRLASIPRLRISEGRVRDLDAPLLDATHMGADGILGMDSLRSERVMFDFNRNLLSIVPSAVREQPDRETIVVRGKLRKGHLILTSAEAEGVKVTVILDTGAEVTIGNSALRRRLEQAGRLSSPRPVELMSVTGQRLPAEAYSIRQLEIGGVTLKDLVIAFADAHTFGRLGLHHKPTILLGMNAMRAFQKVSIDFGSRKLRVLLPQSGELRGTALAAR